MAIPDFQTLMLPVLEFHHDGREHSIREVVDAMAKQLNLTEQEKKQTLPSGRQERLHNRVSWAITYMKKATLLESTRRGCNQIAEPGLVVLTRFPQLRT
jgi:restriction system protein